jgi:hypothetical protein
VTPAEAVMDKVAHPVYPSKAQDPENLSKEN